MDNESSRVSQEEPVAGPSKSARRSESSSSSDSSSNSSSSSSSDPKSRKRKRVRRRHHKKKGGKHKHYRSERKIDRLTSEIADLRRQLGTDNIREADDALSLFAEDDFENEGSHFLHSLDVETKLKEPTVPKTEERYLKILKDIQFFDKSEWSEVRYAETQKLYSHSPGFVELEANEEVRSYDTLKHLAYTERAYSSLTYGMLMQKENLRKELCAFMSWIKDQGSCDIEAINTKVNHIFASGEFSKVSADLLQMICGHRAETIQMRRDGIINAVRDPLVKASLRKIPPSEDSLFNSEQLVTALEKAGGIKKVFWPVTRPGSTNASTSQVGRWQGRPSQGQHTTPQVPSQGKNYNITCMPSQGYGCQHWNAPSQGGNFHNNLQCSSQGQYSGGHDSCTGHAYQNHSQRSGNTVNRGSFRARGARQNQRYQNPRRGGYKRRSSPTGYNAKRSKY